MKRNGKWRTGRLAALLCAALPGCGGDQSALPIEAPQALADSMPFMYPIELWDQKISGETVLLLRVSETGAVDSVLVATASGFREFDSAAVQGARVMRFVPGRQGERRVPMWTRLPVRFQRDTTGQMGLGNP